MLNFAVVNQLKRHIEILLLDNDCVIVPDFGGFVAHRVAARYDENDRTYLPPMRTVGFNSQLRMNDSLLVQSYIEAYDISYPEALRRIESDTDEIRRQLEDEGTCTLDDLGTLTVNMEGKYEFEPFKSGLLTPDLYGLSSFTFKRLRDEAVLAEDSPAREAAPNDDGNASPALLDFISDDDDSVASTISIKKSWIRNAVAIAAAVVAFFLMATPVLNSDLGNQAMSQMNSNLLYKLMPKDTNVTPAQPVVAVRSEKATSPQVSQPAPDHSSHQPESRAEDATEQTQPDATRQHAGSYCIVVASQVRKSNAELFVKQLHQQGYTDAEVYIHNDVVRVICGVFDTASEAYSRLNKMNDKEEFFEAWVYKKPV